MADRFFDTSAFAKHYRAELGTAKVDGFLAETGSRHFISAVGEGDEWTGICLRHQVPMPRWMAETGAHPIDRHLFEPTRWRFGSPDRQASG